MYKIIFTNGKILEFYAYKHGWAKNPGNVLAYLYDTYGKTIGMFNVNDIIAIYDNDELTSMFEKNNNNNEYVILHKFGSFKIINDGYNYMPYNNSIEFKNLNGKIFATINLNNAYGIFKNDPDNKYWLTPAM